MPIAQVNGIRLHYDEYGTGDPVVLVTGTAAPGRIWRTHQVPALRAAGYRPVTLDNRGIAPTEAPAGFTLDDMAADVAGLIEHLGAAPCRVVGFSLGAIIVQELLIARPELVERAVLMATAGRTDALGAAAAQADILLADSGVDVPPRYAAVMSAVHNLSPETLNDEARLTDWLDVFELSSVRSQAARSQLGLQVIPDRRPYLGKVTRPCLVIGFRDDLIVRPHLCREVAEAVPGAVYREIDGCGHYGYLEKPAAVNAAIVEFLGG
ncbi:alpha/beta hydrolase [Actinoplanes sp. NPDC051851]|uniref:alpha/beta fold hydrolase n=1 Tax=Actinoplanes sp. NPDC051851 TaxID=3154753 RepID=UPI0034307E32